MVEVNHSDRSMRAKIVFYCPATDGKYLYFTWEELLGDVWVMDLVGDD